MDLKTLRTARGMKQIHLANAIGVSRAYISYLETGRRPITEEMEARLKKALRLPEGFRIEAKEDNYEQTGDSTRG